MKLYPYLLAILLVVQGCCLAASTSNGTDLQQQQQRPTTSRRPWNIKGSVLLLDVNSFDHHIINTSILLDEASCADACARTPGCGAWTCCSNKYGCGSGCQAYAAQYPQLTPAAGSDPELPDPAWFKLTNISGFGPWGMTSACQVCENGWYFSCKPSDKWPYGVCTLKQALQTASPSFWSTDPNEGWVSGWHTLPKACAGLSLRACSNCLDSVDPAKCLGCAKSPSMATGLLEGALQQPGSPDDPIVRRPEGCAACVNSTAPDACVDCLTTSAPCAACALSQPSGDVQTDVSSCIDCVAKHGEGLARPCVSCAQLGTAQPQQVQQCMSCLDAVAPTACNSTSTNFTGPIPGCWNALYDADTCSTCVTQAKSYDVCLSCLKASPYDHDCVRCATLTEECDQSKCYQCVRAAKHSGGGCYDCTWAFPGAVEQQQCMACLADPQLSWGGKNMCVRACMRWCAGPEARDQCFQCLAKPQDDYFQACACYKPTPGGDHLAGSD